MVFAMVVITMKDGQKALVWEDGPDLHCIQAGATQLHAQEPEVASIVVRMPTPEEVGSN